MIDGQPASDEFELSIFGPGRGECVLLHIGCGDWVCIDSFIDRKTRRPIALSYLEGLGIDPSEALRLLVVTHWHQDHMRGAAEVLQSAPKAFFACSGAFKSHEFRVAVGASEGTRHAQQPLHEFAKILALIQARRGPGVRCESASPNFLHEGSPVPVARSESAMPHVRVVAVSPSHGARMLGMHELAASLPEMRRPKRRAVALAPNQQSVALWVQAGEVKVLLGGDLEDSTDAGVGWKAVLASPTRPDERAGLFKVPHHGSKMHTTLTCGIAC